MVNKPGLIRVKGWNIQESFKMNEQAVPLPAVMMQLISGKWVTQALYVAAKLGVADLLEREPMDSKALAQTTGAEAASLYRVPPRDG
jgi:hypothetical protein